MKYLSNGLKAKNQIVIDSVDSDVQSDISEQKPVHFIKKPQQNPLKFKPMAQICRRQPAPKKPAHRSKLQQIQISDEESEPNIREYSISESHLYQQEEQIERPKPASRALRKRLMKVSNKCKIEGKYLASECSICLSSLEHKDPSQIGHLECKHTFCFDCILQSSKFSTRCPYCRASFLCIIRDGEQIQVQQRNLEDEEDPYDEPCYVCGRNDDFDHLLQCEYCQAAFCHTYCDNRLESDVPPEGSWYCLSCSSLV